MRSEPAFFWDRAISGKRTPHHIRKWGKAVCRVERQSRIACYQLNAANPLILTAQKYSPDNHISTSMVPVSGFCVDAVQECDRTRRILWHRHVLQPAHASACCDDPFTLHNPGSTGASAQFTVQFVSVCFFNSSHPGRINHLMLSMPHLFKHETVVAGEGGDIGSGCLTEDIREIFRMRGHRKIITSCQDPWDARGYFFCGPRCITAGYDTMVLAISITRPLHTHW